ncbi:MAG: lysylphosphatidylglycerol synthase transmembrane domain-containing protein [Cyclobacteriaceae bacterium]
MSKKYLTFIKVIISVGLACFLLFLVFRNIEWESFREKATTVDYSWVIYSILLSVVAYVARAYRWNILLKPLGYDLKTSRTTIAVLIGYFANLALPRLGEITRCGVLNRNDRVPVPVALGTVVVDRIADVLMLFILMAAGLLLESDLLLKFLGSAYSDLKVPAWVPVIFVVVGLSGFIGLVIFIKKQHKLKGRFAEMVKGFVAGIISLKNIEKPIGFLVSTLVIWVVYYLMSYLIVFSLPETSHLDFSAGLLLLITGGIAISLPVQSGFGTYHGMIAGMLLLYSVEQETGIFLATLLHTSQIIAIAFFGTIALVISFLIRRKQNQTGEIRSYEQA